MPTRNTDHTNSNVEGLIRLFLEQTVMLDVDLAKLFEVPTKALNQAVRRNPERFPADFMFQLTAEETLTLRSQFVTSNLQGGRGYAPYAFTEDGVAMHTRFHPHPAMDRPQNVFDRVANGLPYVPRNSCTQKAEASI